MVLEMCIFISNKSFAMYMCVNWELLSLTTESYSKDEKDGRENRKESLLLGKKLSKMLLRDQAVPI